MHGLLIFTLATFLIGCSNIKTEKNLISQNPNGNLTPLEVQTVLTKYHYINGGDFEFKIFPITKSYIMSELNQLVQIRGFSNKEKQSFIKSREEQYTKNSTCAFFEISSINVTSEESLQNWDISIASNLGGVYPVRFPNSSVKTFSSLFRGIRGPNEKWTSYGIGCSRVKVPIENGFSIILKRLDQNGERSHQSKVTWGK
jgi:hypothetical protein